MASGRRTDLKPRPLLYGAQDVARFCEVDLKTVHHWAERGKIPFFRTEGRHLRFRRNDVVRFLRAYAIPMPEEVTRARPVVAFALGANREEIAKKLGPRFSLRRHGSAIAAIARLCAEEPDVLVFELGDATLGDGAIAELKREVGYVLYVGIGEGECEGADVILSDPSRLAAEIARALAVA